MDGGLKARLHREWSVTIHIVWALPKTKILNVILIFCPPPFAGNHVLQSLWHRCHVIVYDLRMPAEQFPLLHRVLQKLALGPLLARLPRVDNGPPAVFYGVHITPLARPLKQIYRRLFIKPSSNNPGSVNGAVVLKKEGNMPRLFSKSVITTIILLQS